MSYATAMDFYQKTWLESEFVLSEIEAAGVGFDKDACGSEHTRLHADIQAQEERLNSLTGKAINWRSPKQIAEYLYDELEFETPPVKGGLHAVQLCKAGDRPTSEAALHHFANKAPDERTRQSMETLISLRAAYKLSGYFENLPEHIGHDGRIHPDLSPSTETGRLACRNPNLQNQPSDTRNCFVAGPGNALVCLDYSGLEWRILAHILAYRYSDMSLVQEVREGIDPHSATAQRMFPECEMVPVGQIKKLFPDQRHKAKTMNYAINYGKTAAGLAAQLKISYQEAVRLLKKFYQTNPGIKKWHEFVKRYARSKGYVRSILGRFRFLDYTEDVPEWVHKKSDRLALNTPIQASAADIVTLAMVKCYNSTELQALGAKLILQIHDELLFECPEENAIKVQEVASDVMRQAMQDEKEFLCPLDVDGGVGYNWKEAGGK